MKIVVLYHEPLRGSTDDLDVLVQRNAVSEALCSLGHQPVPLACGLNFDMVSRQLRELEPDLVFNLVESLGGTDRLAVMATLLLDALRVPYTGCPTRGTLISNDKLSAKELLVSKRLPTPAWWARGQLHGGTIAAPIEGPEITGRYIIKAVAEHASVGLEDDAVINVTSRWQLDREVRERSMQLGVPCFAEQFIEGREFNLSLLANGEGAVVLPPAEIDFNSFSAERPRIVGYRAKWDPNSFEYHQTPRKFEFSPHDQPLLGRLGELALSCWETFGLTGYARVDFRVDDAGTAWVLEVNTNPCLSPDAGFAAAAERGGLSYTEMVRCIAEAAIAERLARP